jgi:hypothetical protein
MTLLCVLCLGSESNGPRLAMRTFSFTILFHLQTKGSVPGEVACSLLFHFGHALRLCLLLCGFQLGEFSAEKACEGVAIPVMAHRLSESAI